jgi:hypothetical protein
MLLDERVLELLELFYDDQNIHHINRNCTDHIGTIIIIKSNQSINQIIHHKKGSPPQRAAIDRAEGAIDRAGFVCYRFGQC